MNTQKHYSQNTQQLIKRLVYFALLILLLADTGYSFLQHYGQPLDGDMVESVLPLKSMEPLFDCPSGIDVIVNNQKYHNPNRFFSHWILNKYFNSFPFLLQKFTEPINSIYLSCAISKTIFQLIIIYLLSMFITGTTNILKLDFIIAAVLITPLFQTNGYRGYMGIIDPSITYTFFYALPIIFLLFYFSPFIFQVYHKKEPKIKTLKTILLFILAIMTCLSGPLNPGIVLVFAMLVFFNITKENFIQSNQKGIIHRAGYAIRMIPKSYWFFIAPISILALYSIYIGTYNSTTIANKIPLGELYSRLPSGVYYQFTQKLGFPVIFTILVLNTVLIIKRYRSNEGSKILKTFKWIGVFALIYILLLPLGGYREYRQNILRYDTILPITLSLIFIFGASTLYLLNRMSKKQKLWYIPVLVSVLFIFTNADNAEFDKNICERNALKKIAESPNKVVELHNDCTVLSWNKIAKPEDSRHKVELLYNWGIIKEKKLYYHK